MNYLDGEIIKAGDIVQIDEQYQGHVVANIDTYDYLPGQDSWAYLKTGIMIDTDFGGLVHYTDMEDEKIVLIRRA